MNRSIAGQHFLRTMFELTEDQEASLEQQEISIEKLNFARAWNPRELSDTIRRATNAEWITRIGSQIRLTKKGRIEAERLTREHRLWELFLIHHADFAPSRVDREADHIEHVLEPEIVAELEALLSENQKTIPQSPHLLAHHVAEDELQTRHAEPTHSSGNRE
jgi:manganese/zinc/iron transport system permease protein